MTAPSIISRPAPDPGITIEDLYRLTVAQYHAIGDASILEEDDPVELLEGCLVCKYGPFDPSPLGLSAPPPASPGDEERGLTLAWIWRFTVEQYHAMIDDGILTEGEPVELLEGWLVRKMTQKPPHPIAVELARDALAGKLSQPYYVRTQAPISLSEGEPEPDLALVRGDRRDYLQRHPGPADVLLVVEVADTSLARDRGIKRQMYARAGILAYWIVNLVERQIEVYSVPSSAPASDYVERRDYVAGESVPVVIEGVEVGRLEVRELLP